MQIDVIACVRGLIALSATTVAGAVLAQTGTSFDACGSLDNAFGPYDYRTESRANLSLVEVAHFTPGVEALLKGKSGYLGADIDYTLRAFPNHHRALVAAARYGQQQKSDPPPHMNYTVECYFVRAVRFRTDDLIVRMLYAQFLDGMGRGGDAVSQLDYVADAAVDSATTQYNLALLHIDARRYDLALKHAHRAYALGVNRTEARDRLMAAGQWKEPANALPYPPASAAPR
jgi:hypothetical protein